MHKAAIKIGSRIPSVEQTTAKIQLETKYLAWSIFNLHLQRSLSRSRCPFARRRSSFNVPIVKLE